MIVRWGGDVEDGNDDSIVILQYLARRAPFPYSYSPLKWSTRRWGTASLQASPLAWLQATRTAKSFAGAIQTTAIHIVLLPPWLRAGPPAQGWPSTIIQPMAYFGS